MRAWQLIEELKAMDDDVELNVLYPGIDQLMKITSICFSDDIKQAIIRVDPDE